MTFPHLSQIAVAHQSFFFYDTMALTLTHPTLLRLAALLGLLLQQLKQLKQPQGSWKPEMEELREAVASGEIAGIEQFWQRWRECDPEEEEKEETAKTLLNELEKSWGFLECSK